MMRVLTKCMLVAAVASLAFAGSTTASFAAKKKAAKAKACTPWTYQTRAGLFRALRPRRQVVPVDVEFDDKVLK